MKGTQQAHGEEIEPRQSCDLGVPLGVVTLKCSLKLDKAHLYYGHYQHSRLEPAGCGRSRPCKAEVPTEPPGWPGRPTGPSSRPSELDREPP